MKEHRCLGRVSPADSYAVVISLFPYDREGECVCMAGNGDT